MTTVISCPQCKNDLQVPPESVGREARCPLCAHVFTAANTLVRTAPPPVPAERSPIWERSPEGALAKPLDEDEAHQLEADAGKADGLSTNSAEAAR